MELAAGVHWKIRKNVIGGCAAYQLGLTGKVLNLKRPPNEQSTRQTNPRPYKPIRASPEERKRHHKAIQPRGYSGPQASTRNNRG